MKYTVLRTGYAQHLEEYSIVLCSPLRKKSAYTMYMYNFFLLESETLFDTAS